MGWLRWSALYCTALLLEMRLWLATPATGGGTEPPTLPMLRVFLDLWSFTSLQKVCQLLSQVRPCVLGHTLGNVR